MRIATPFNRQQVVVAPAMAWPGTENAPWV
jgi:hypothetical protein